MSPLSLFRRWLARHPLAWVLALALVQVGAQTAGVVHELSHGLPGQPGPTALVAIAADLAASPATAPAASPATATASGTHLGASSDCLTCLAVAALVGAAPAPGVASVAAPVDVAVHRDTPTVAVSPRTWRAYASRAPPLLLVA